LISLLLPTVRNVREGARSAKCQNNVRSIYQAETAAAAENEEILPDPPSGTSQVYPNPPGLAYYFKGGSNNIEFTHGELMKRLGPEDQRPSLMMCPDVDDGAPNYSYAFSEDAFDKPYRRFTQVVRPSEKI